VRQACCDDGGEGYRAAQRTEAVAKIELHDLVLLDEGDAASDVPPGWV
jgi:hypothetical protein